MAAVVVALVASLLALSPRPTPAGAQDDPPGQTTQTSWMNDCIGAAGGFEQPQTEPTSISVTAPPNVAPNEEFTIRIAPDEASFPDQQDTVAGIVTILSLQDIDFMYALPTNATVQSVAIAPDTGFGTSGTPTVKVDNTYTPARIVLEIPMVPKNNRPPTNATFFQFPAVDVTLTATGPIGSNVVTRVAGTNRADSGYTFRANNSVLPAQVECWPAGLAGGPTMSQTSISSGSVTEPTTTTLTVDPTVIPGGNSVTMQATVTAPSGVVRFFDGATSLGLALLDDNGVATLTAPLNNVGERSITAQFLGSPGFEVSTSEPVIVTVTNPADRVPVQVQVTFNPPMLNLGTTTDFSMATVTVTSTEPGLTPTGTVRLYDDDQLVSTQQLVEGAMQHQLQVAAGGHAIRAEYVGDTAHFAGTGTSVLSAAHSDSPTQPATRLALSGDPAVFNGATMPLPGQSFLASSFRTAADGSQSLGGGIAYFASTTFNLANGGTITGRFAQVGVNEGGIEPGNNADAWLSGDFMFEVTGADFNNGQGAQTFASTCVVGPFEVNLEGVRTAPGAALNLSQGGFSVPFAPSGSCVNAEGIVRSGQVGAALAGAQTSLDFVVTPPAAAAMQVTSPVVASPAGGSSFGQPVTLSATVSRVDSANISGTPGAIQFYVNGVLLGAADATGATGPTKTATLTAPRAGSTGQEALPPLPEGNVSIYAKFVPSNAQKLVYAESVNSPSMTYTVLPPVQKLTPVLTLSVPEVAAVTEPVTLTLTLDPAPNSAPGVADLAGAIRIYDRNEPNPALQEIAIPFVGFNSAFLNAVEVTGSSDGTYVTQTALAPGEHSLEAVFVPAVESAWGWEPATSAQEPHVVVGEQIPTSLEVISDSTRGTNLVPFSSSQNFTGAWYNVQVTPRIAATQTAPFDQGFTPFGLTRINPVTGGVLFDSFNSAGVAPNIALNQPLASVVGPAEQEFYYDPARRDPATNMPTVPGNQGFGYSEGAFVYEVVNPVESGPVPTGLDILSVNPSPVTQGSVWSQINGHVSWNAPGTVNYTARNVSTAEVTNLGTANVSTTTSAISGRGLARLSNSAVTATLPAGAYEVRGSYTPTNPALWAPSSSDVFLVHVLGAGDSVPTETTLGVLPAGISAPGQPVILEATVEPGTVAQGTVEFFDGEASLGTATLAGGWASIIAYDLAEGEHQLSAVFTSSNPDVDSSGSVLVPHLVAAGEETTTVLTVSPEDESLQGEDVTLTAAIAPEEAVGTVLFEDEHGVLGDGPVEVVEGEAVLMLDDLEPGTHEIVAAFTADNPADFGDSISEVVSHEVIAQSVPQAPQDVTATPGGLQATVTWTPGDDGGQPISSYTVSTSPGDVDDVTVSGAVTTVDIIGLSADEDYSFTVVATNSLGSSEPSEASNTVTVGEAEKTFSDVPSDHAFFSEITWMAEVDLSTGYEDGTYLPSATLTRQAMSAFLYRLNGSPNGAEPECTEPPFSDVPVDHTFCGEIAWMAEAEISTGYSDGTYRPMDGLSREAMSAFLYRSAGNPNGVDPTCTEPPFTDVPVTNTFCGEIAWMAEVGISEGYEDGTYRPVDTLTRQAMSAFLYRYTLVVQTDIV